MISCHFRQYCSGVYCRTGVNCFWITDNSQQVLSALSKINYFSTAKHFDFSTLYTSIPHTSLKEALTSLVKEAHKVRDNIFLVADTTGTAFWTDVPSRAASKHNITEESLTKLAEYLIDNISIGNGVYRQCVGIPMGTDCAPLRAKLFLFYYEYRYMYMKNLIKNNIILAKKTNNTMRCIDDLQTLHLMMTYMYILQSFCSKRQQNIPQHYHTCT